MKKSNKYKIKISDANFLAIRISYLIAVENLEEHSRNVLQQSSKNVHIVYFHGHIKCSCSILRYI